jgi:hypothetical protein
MAQDDYAVLIGIESYPTFGAGGSPMNLKGPLNDLESIRTWLVSPNGGHLPPENIQVAMSPSPPDPASKHPNFSEVHECFDKILQANKKKNKYY